MLRTAGALGSSTTRDGGTFAAAFGRPVASRCSFAGRQRQLCGAIEADTTRRVSKKYSGFGAAKQSLAILVVPFFSVVLCFPLLSFSGSRVGEAISNPWLRYSDNHQALMAIRAGEWQAVLYDGKADPHIRKAAQQACKPIAVAYAAVYPGTFGEFDVSVLIRFFLMFNYFLCLP